MNPQLWYFNSPVAGGTMTTAAEADHDKDDETDTRIMNDTTMPPPPGGNRRDQAAVSRSSNSADQRAAASAPRPATGASTIAAAPARQKTGRFGLSEWNRLLTVSKDLAQLHGRGLRNIPPKEIMQHNTVHDGWIVLKGKVYRISPYLAYHPGGESILKNVLGKDATALFQKYHRWVNEEALIGKLLIGYLDQNVRGDDDDDDDEHERKRSSYLPQPIQSTSREMAPPKNSPKPTEG